MRHASTLDSMSEVPIGPLRRAKTRLRHVLEPFIYAVFPRYAEFIARRSWDRSAREMPREATATPDARDWPTYWSSGERDVERLLGFATGCVTFGRRRAVDLGCGLGRLTRPLASRFAEVIGLDIAPEMLQIATAQASLPNVRFVLIRRMGRLPVPTRSTDFAIAWTVFRHMPKAWYRDYLRELHRILVPGGCLVFEAQVRDTPMAAEPPPYVPYTDREFARSELRRDCVEHGFVWVADETEPAPTAGALTLSMVWQKSSH